jgi:hypothetical protein
LVVGCVWRRLDGRGGVVMSEVMVVIIARHFYGI